MGYVHPDRTAYATLPPPSSKIGKFQCAMDGAKVLGVFVMVAQIEQIK